MTSVLISIISVWLWNIYWVTSYKVGVFRTQLCDTSTFHGMLYGLASLHAGSTYLCMWPSKLTLASLDPCRWPFPLCSYFHVCLGGDMLHDVYVACVYVCVASLDACQWQVLIVSSVHLFKVSSDMYQLSCKFFASYKVICVTTSIWHDTQLLSLNARHVCTPLIIIWTLHFQASRLWSVHTMYMLPCNIRTLVKWG